MYRPVLMCERNCCKTLEFICLFFIFPFVVCISFFFSLLPLRLYNAVTFYSLANKARVVVVVAVVAKSQIAPIVEEKVTFSFDFITFTVRTDSD